MTDHTAAHEAVIVGTGPTGSTCALVLARHGWGVTLVERDTSAPSATGDDSALEGWKRPGVAQFHQPHTFTARLLQEMRQSLPDVVDDVLAQKDVLLELSEELTTARVRRSTFELAMRRAVEAQAGVRVVHDNADRAEVADGRVTGLRLRSGAVLPAELVVDAGGRRSRLTRGYVGEETDESTHMVYVNRRYRVRPGRAFPGPVNRGIVGVAPADAYSALVFPHDAGTFTVGFTYLPEDEALAGLRHRAAFEAAVRTVPMLDEWLDPDRVEPASDVLVMAGLRNLLRTLRADAPLGLHAVGDAVCTTNPSFGRGTTLAVLSALCLARAAIDAPDDPGAWRAAVDRWQREELRPWFEDSLEMDRARLARWEQAFAGGVGAPSTPAGPPTGAGGPPPGVGGPPDPSVLRAMQRRMHMVDPVGSPSGPPPGAGGPPPGAGGPPPGAGGPPPGAGGPPSAAPPRAEMVEVVRAALEEDELLAVSA